MKKQILKTVYTLLCCIFLFIPVIQSKEKPLELQINPYTGAISGLKIPGDKQNMEWLVKTDGSQYAWIKEDYGWGLGYFTVDRDRKSLKREYRKRSHRSGRRSRWGSGNQKNPALQDPPC